ncbi:MULTISPECIES: hypothetical protein [unclassified Micromonospora]|uniref:hypothetical protein n=1 Tax=unclassified Micromonospora TaxID=2617518 RepID=UPI0033177EDB
MAGDVLRRHPRERVGSARGLVRLFVHTDPVALIGIALSISLSVTLDLTNAATGVESLLAGLMGITISLLVDSLARAERRFHLRTLLEGPPWLVHGVPPLVTAAREAVEAHPGTRVAEEARRRFERFRVETEQLRAGRIVRPGDDYEDLLAGLADCVRYLDAVTHVMPRVSGELSWWHSDIGRAYWAANLEALERGVRITRIFVHAGVSDELSELVETQRRAGVRAGLLRWGSVRPDLHVNLALWDGTSAWEPTMSAHGEITLNQFSVNPGDLERLRTAFATCAREATYQ